MAKAECRRIHELIARYEHVPGLKDIYVEGSDDKCVLDGIFKHQGVKNVAVFEISTVHVPTEPGEDSGCRTKVVTLARELAKAFRGKERHVACVIDSDLDHAIGAGESDELLLRTDYASMELYFFTKDVFEKLNNQCLRNSILTDRMVNEFMASTLQLLFCVRCVNARPEWHLNHYCFERQVSFDGEQFGFDMDTYVSRYLNKNGRLAQREEFLRQIRAVEVPDDLDRRCFMHGHDFLLLLRKMLNVLRGRSIYKKEEVFTLLRACANYEFLAEEPMVATLLQSLR